MRRVSHRCLRSLSVRFFSPLRRFLEAPLLREPHAPRCHACSQPTKTSTDEEDELVCSLVQDAFSSAGAVSSCSSSALQGKGVHQGTSPADSVPGACGSGSEVKAEAAVDGRCLAPLGPLHSAETDSHTLNRPYEKFVRVRLCSYTHTVKELKDVSNRGSNVEWMCMRCQTYNFIGRKSCRHCGASELDSHRESHPPARHIALFPSAWICEKCGHQNANKSHSNSPPRTSSPSSSHKASAGALISHLPVASAMTAAKEHRAKFFCARCSQPFGGIREWYCSYCNHINSKASTQCSTCFAERTEQWGCSACGYAFNSIFTIGCYMCKQHRPMKVSTSTILCPGCGIHNDYRWELCEACMSPLPSMGKIFWGGKVVDSQETLSSTHLPPKNIGPNLTLTPLRHTAEGQREKTGNCLQKASSAGPPVASVSTPLSFVAKQSATSPQSVPCPPPPTTTETNGAWWCTKCNVIQRRNATFCDICLRPRSLAEEITAPSRTLDSAGSNEAERHSEEGPSEHASLSLPPIGSWQCPYCRQFKGAQELKCCNKMREVLKGYWLCCACASVNRKDREVCLGCGAPPTLPEHWSCGVCEFSNPKSSLTCERCGTEHALLWRCPRCDLIVPQSHATCTACAAHRPTLPAPTVCPVCRAPNAVVRASCFRCHARLKSAWQCTSCHASCEDRALPRCPECRAPHIYDEEEETWVCEVCATAIASGGDIPVRQQCPKCRADRVQGCIVFPSRWRCTRCGIFNNTAHSQCTECSAPRRMPATFHTTVACPQCFRQTGVDAKEECANCGFSLSDMITDAVAMVHINPRLGVINTLCANADSSFTGSEAAGLDVDSEPPP